MFATHSKLWSRFWTVGLPFFRSERRGVALGLLGVLVALLLGVSGFNVLSSYVLRDLMTAIAERHSDRYYPLAFWYFVVFAASTVVAVFYGYTEGRLGLVWRQWLTSHLIGRYLTGRAYYRINSREDIDNPDQRISEDVKNFTVTTLTFGLLLLNAIITLCAFLGVLWSITPWLFVVAVGYAALGSLLTIVLGRRLVGLNNQQLKKEADFRYELVHVREHAESLALIGGERTEQARLGGRLRELVENYKAIILVSRNLGFFTTGYNYLIQLVPILIAAPLYLRGDVEFGVVTQALVAFTQVVNAFSVIVVQFQNLSTFAAVVARLGSLWEAIEETASATGRAIRIVEDDRRVAFLGLTLQTPKQGRLLIKDLNLEVPVGRRLLIEGHNGAGKSALFRATIGIWEGGEGTIVRPAREKVMFLPQRPYTLPGTLRDQFACAAPGNDVSEERLLAALAAVHFDSVLQRVGGLDVEHDWANVLSPGEQQLVAFARLLLMQPPFAFLDEATKAVGGQRARNLYKELAKTPVTYLSVTDQPGLQEFHDQVLDLHPDGTWTLGPTRQPEPASS
jgi:putative ATP-binding cassette transporter